MIASYFEALMHRRSNMMAENLFTVWVEYVGKIICEKNGCALPKNNGKDIVIWANKVFEKPPVRLCEIEEEVWQEIGEKLRTWPNEEYNAVDIALKLVKQYMLRYNLRLRDDSSEAAFVECALLWAYMAKILIGALIIYEKSFNKYCEIDMAVCKLLENLRGCHELSCWDELYYISEEIEIYLENKKMALL